MWGSGWYPVFGVAALVAGLVVACETVPYTGRSQLQFMSPEQESQMGVQAFQQTLAKVKVSSDAAASEMVTRVGSRIAAVTGHPEYRWEYRLIQDDKQTNAFALPGGKVAVYTGILPITRDENGPAAVLGHEISHVVARHGGDRISQQILVNVGLETTMATLPTALPLPSRPWLLCGRGDRRGPPSMEPRPGIGSPTIWVSS